MVFLIVTLSKLSENDLYKLESELYQEAFVCIWAFLAQWFVRRRFLNDPTCFCTFVIISLKRTWSLICTILN
jgi:hypothetical protein